MKKINGPFLTAAVLVLFIVEILLVLTYTPWLPGDFSLELKSAFISTLLLFAASIGVMMILCVPLAIAAAVRPGAALFAAAPFAVIESLPPTLVILAVFSLLSAASTPFSPFLSGVLAGILTAPYFFHALLSMLRPHCGSSLALVLRSEGLPLWRILLRLIMSKELKGRVLGELVSLAVSGMLAHAAASFVFETGLGAARGFGCASLGGIMAAYREDLLFSPFPFRPLLPCLLLSILTLLLFLLARSLSKGREHV